MGTHDIPLQRRSSRPWRPVVALVAAYALVLQALLLGVVVASQAARAADGTADRIICLTHEGVAAPAPSDPSDGPNQHSDCAANCLLCAEGIHAVALAPPGNSLSPVSAGETLRWHRPEWLVSALFDNPVAQPRGPPLAA
jgi:hypothetical protein